MKTDILQTITNTIIEAIEAGVSAYKMPWNTSGGFSTSPINASSRKAYRGINVIQLWASAQKQGFASGEWATYSQWTALGAQVRKGEKSTPIVFWKFFKESKEDTATPAGEIKANAREFAMCRSYNVFNANQVDGYEPKEAPIKSENERMEAAEAFFALAGVKALPGGNRAYYSPANDSVHMPEIESFHSVNGYYSVLAHESGHWTGHSTRLDRDLKNRFGSEAYAMEELVAELTAAFTCATIGIPTEPRTDHAPYIASWLQVLKGDKRAIITAASQAQKALDYLCRNQEQDAQEETEEQEQAA